MPSLFQIVGLCCFVMAAPACALARSAWIDVGWLIWLLIGAVFLVGGSVMHELRQLRPPRTPKNN